VRPRLCHSFAANGKEIIFEMEADNMRLASFRRNSSTTTYEV